MPGSWRARHDRIPEELAKILYAKVKELATKDPSPVSVARQLSASCSLSISPGTVRHWMIGDRRKPDVMVRNFFKYEPSPALSYIIGANKGDGCTMAKSGIVKLEVTDKDFAQAFNANMATLFSRVKPNKILVRRRVGRLPMYIVKYFSRQLVRLLRQPLKKLLELASAFPRDFLRGFFDAEGHVDVGVTENFQLSVGAENSNKSLLLRVKKLFKDCLIIDSRLNRKRKAGSVKVIRGRPFIMRRTSYSLMIRRISDLRRFAELVSFSISRKALKLKDALSIVTVCEARSRPAAWRRLYSKKGGEWIREETCDRAKSKSIKQETKGPFFRAGSLVR